MENFGGWAINNNRRSGGRCYDVSLGPIGFPAATPDCPNGLLHLGVVRIQIGKVDKSSP